MTCSGMTKVMYAMLNDIQLQLQTKFF